MNTLKIAAAAALLTMASAGAAFADSDTGSGTLVILRPVTVTKVTDLSFGTVTLPTGPENLVIAADATGTRTLGGTMTGVGAAGDSAEFTIDGEGGQSVDIDIDTDGDFVITDGTNNLTVTTTNSLDAGFAFSEALDGSLGGPGTLTMYIGGSVPLDATTASGTYTGTFTVTADYT